MLDRMIEESVQLSASLNLTNKPTQKYLFFESNERVIWGTQEVERNAPPIIFLPKNKFLGAELKMGKLKTEILYKRVFGR
jgi:hypothetical protein